MKYNFSLSVIILVLVVAMSSMVSCKKATKTPPPAKDFSFVEEFDSIQYTYNRGWAFVNNSNPQGTATWTNGYYEVGKGGAAGFPARSYKLSPREYAFCGFNSGGGLAELSSWMMTPEIEIKNGDKFMFYTRTMSTVTYPDRMQVRANFNNGGTDVGRTFTSVGDFNRLIFDINPGLASSGANGYPTDWRKYEYTVSGLTLNTPQKARFAFRYFLSGGGPSGSNSDGIGVDSVAFVSVK